MQKSDIFGVMKAQGISSRYIAFSVIAQTFLFSNGGRIGRISGDDRNGVGLAASCALSSKQPLFAGISVLMILIAIVGAFFSVRTIVKIDPLKAIG